MASKDSREEGITLRQREKYFVCFSFSSSLQPSIMLSMFKHLFQLDRKNTFGNFIFEERLITSYGSSNQHKWIHNIYSG